MKTLRAILLPVLLAFLGSCGKVETEYILHDSSTESCTVILYADGYNNLCPDIRDNIATISGDVLPQLYSRKHILVYAHCSRTGADFTTPMPSHLVELTLDEFGGCMPDTLLVLDTDKSALDPAVMRQVLLAAKEYAPADHYGLILSSHGSGWLPQGYYSNGDSSLDAVLAPPAKPLAPIVYNGPLTKSFGGEFYFDAAGKRQSTEMEISTLSTAIPIHLDFLVFDACLMGGVEVAYELKDVADVICFSPAEVVSSGFDYTNLAPDLLADGFSPERFCRHFFERYDAMSGSYRSATITAVRTSGLESLAQCCSTLFEKYRGALSSLSGSGVQGYFRFGRHFFYDLKDILDKAGATPEEIAGLQAALDGCIIYKAATPTLFNEITVREYSGFSMYLPSQGTARLNAFYRTLAWNRATSLVK